MRDGQTPLWDGGRGPSPPVGAARAIEALMLAGARNPDLRPVALGLRRLTGQTSFRALATKSPGSFDRLDGFLASMVAQGFGARAQWRFAEEGPQGVEAVVDAMDHLFPTGALPPVE
jgi:hypothetical protein